MMTSSEIKDADTELIEKLKSESRHALQNRPVFSVRSRISIGFILWFILSLGITVASFFTLTKIQSKLYFMESAGRYIFGSVENLITAPSRRCRLTLLIK